MQRFTEEQMLWRSVFNDVRKYSDEVFLNGCLIRVKIFNSITSSTRLLQLCQALDIFRPSNVLKISRTFLPAGAFWVPDSALPSGPANILVYLDEELQVTQFQDFWIIEDDDPFNDQYGCIFYLLHILYQGAAADMVFIQNVSQCPF